MVKDLLLQHWEISKPDVLVSIIGGDEIYESNPGLGDAISKGIAQVKTILRWKTSFLSIHCWINNLISNYVSHKRQNKKENNIGTIIRYICKTEENKQKMTGALLKTELVIIS